MLQGSCPSRTAPDFVLERIKSGDVRKMPQFTHVTADIGHDVRGKRFNVRGELHGMERNDHQ